MYFLFGLGKQWILATKVKQYHVICIVIKDVNSF